MDYLLLLKSTVEVYVHGTLESSNESTRELLKSCLDSTMSSQGATYDEMVDEKKAAEAVKLLLEAVGEDPERDGLKDTPCRVARMYTELLAGMDEDPHAHLSRVFESDSKGVVLERDIPFYSLCEHHMLPFFGTVHIAYIPDGRVTGISKLARTVEGYAKRLQIQEHMTAQIADAVHGVLEKTPPELAADITTRGIVFTGGGSLLSGLTELIEERTGINVMVAENPADCVAIGAGKYVEMMDRLGRIDYM